MELRICPKCNRPFLESEKSCPRCAKTEYTWNQESWANMGCFVAMLAFAFLLIFLPLILFIMAFLQSVL